jgi:hypothetical protein
VLFRSSNAGYSKQNSQAIAIGTNAAYFNQGSNGIAIGRGAGETIQGPYSIAIGYLAGQNSQSVSSIVINATNTALDTSDPGLYVQPLRSATSSGYGLWYDNSRKEILYDTAKTFVIDHPLQPAEKYLVHACLEGPEAGVYYRGKAEIPASSSTTVVHLPDYVCALAEDLTVQVTAIYNGTVRTLNASEVDTATGSFTVFGAPGPFHWTVYGRRKTIDVEPRKDAVALQGDGPYRWISPAPL